MLSGPNKSPNTLESLLKARASAIREARLFFEKNGILEVDVPILSRGISPDAHIDFLETKSGNTGLFLQTSPELYLKRLLVLGVRDPGYLGKSFRNGEVSDRHQPEFQMAEWYRLGYPMQEMVNETLAFCFAICGNLPVTPISHAELFLQKLGVNSLTCSREDLLNLPDFDSLEINPELVPTRPDVLDVLMSQIIEPDFDPLVLTLVSGFPLDQAAQALGDPEIPGAARRFEIFGGGMELANGYEELMDGAEYRRRFKGEKTRRMKAFQPKIPENEAFLASMDKGLPACCGVAVGLDRLIMLRLGADSIEKILPFEFKDW